MNQYHFVHRKSDTDCHRWVTKNEMFLSRNVNQFRGRDSSVGVANRYGLDGPGIESRWRARFFVPVQTGPAAHPASYAMGTGSFPGVKRPGRGADHQLPSSAEVEGRLELNICSLSGPSWPVLG